MKASFCLRASKASKEQMAERRARGAPSSRVGWKGGNTPTGEELPQEIFSKIRPWEPAGVGGGTAGR